MFEGILTTLVIVGNEVELYGVVRLRERDSLASIPILIDWSETNFSDCSLGEGSPKYFRRQASIIRSAGISQPAHRNPRETLCRRVSAHRDSKGSDTIAIGRSPIARGGTITTMKRGDEGRGVSPYNQHTPGLAESRLN